MAHPPLAGAFPRVRGPRGPTAGLAGEPVVFPWEALVTTDPVPIAASRPDDALRRLLEGNRRYASDRMEHPRQGAPRRDEVAAAQHPFAALLGCSDSRVPA